MSICLYDRESLEDFLQAMSDDAAQVKVVQGHLDTIDALFTNCKQEEASLIFLKEQLAKVCDILNQIDGIVRFKSGLRMFVRNKILKEIVEPWQAQVDDDLEMPRAERVLLEQKSAALCVEQATNHQQLLRELKPIAECTFPSCYVSYAWPTASKRAQECWVQPLLEQMRDEMKCAGVRMILDTKDCSTGENPVQFMMQCERTTFALIVGTEALLQKHNEGTGNVCTELAHLARRKESEQKMGIASHIWVLLLSGTVRTAIPPPFLDLPRFDMRTLGYVATLHKLITMFQK